jgi:hypothetical protein
VGGLIALVSCLYAAKAKPNCRIRKMGFFLGEGELNHAANPGCHRLRRKFAIAGFRVLLENLQLPLERDGMVQNIIC